MDVDMVDGVDMVLLSAKLLFGKDFLENSVYVSPAGLKVLYASPGLRYALLGFYVAGL